MLLRCSPWVFLVVMLPVAAFAGSRGDQPDPDIQIAGRLAENNIKDKRSKAPSQVHPIKMKAGFDYRIDMVSRDVDAFLRLEDNAGKQLDEDNDSGGELNARIIFHCSKDGDYRVICTSIGSRMTGSYKLTIKTSIKAAKITMTHQQLIGTAAADFKADFAVNGLALHLSDLKGKVVLLQFWDARLEASVAAMESLREWNTKYKTDGLEVVSVTFYQHEIGQKLGFDKEAGKLTRAASANKKSDQEALVQYAAHHKLEHLLLVLTKEEALPAFEAYAVNGVPETVLIDRSGKIRLISTAADKAGGELNDEIKKLLAEK